MNKSPKKIFLMAGEASGDLQAAALIEKLKTQVPDWQFLGVGGPRMAKAGAMLIYDSTLLGVIGITTALIKLPEMCYKYHNLKRIIKREKPDLLILIDSPALNMRLAKYAKNLKIPTLYYFPPSAWGKGSKKAHKVSQLVDMVIPVFEFTAQVYEREGLPYRYFGHPLLDVLEETRPNEELKKSFAPDEIIMGLLPGSRFHEIKSMLAVMLETARQLKQKFPKLVFLLPLANPAYREKVEKQIRHFDLPVTIVPENTIAALKICDLILTSSGSVTLEAAGLGIPMVVVYRLPKADWLLAQLLLKYQWIALPNIILGQGIIPEYLQDQATPELLVPALSRLVQEPELRKHISTQLLEVKKFMGKPGVIAQVAEFILNFTKNAKS